MKKEERFKWYKYEFEKIHKKIKRQPNISLYDFYRIRNFKLQNSSRENEKIIKEITKKAFKNAKKGKIEDAINELKKLSGVRIPIASTILAMKFPKEYAIIDKRVIEALGKKEWLKNYLTDTKTYEKYLKLLRKKAKKNKKSLREFERELYESYKK